MSEMELKKMAKIAKTGNASPAAVEFINSGRSVEMVYQANPIMADPRVAFMAYRVK